MVDESLLPHVHVCRSECIHTAQNYSSCCTSADSPPVSPRLVMQFVVWTPIPRVVRDVGEISLLRLTARHFPSLVKPKENVKNKHPQRDCKVCSALGKLKRSRYECSQCEAGLCITNCFEIYHTRKDFKRCLKRRMTSSPVDQQI